jgi:ribosomal protein S27E
MKSKQKYWNKYGKPKPLPGYTPIFCPRCGKFSGYYKEQFRYLVATTRFCCEQCGYIIVEPKNVVYSKGDKYVSR